MQAVKFLFNQTWGKTCMFWFISKIKFFSFFGLRMIYMDVKKLQTDLNQRMNAFVISVGEFPARSKYWPCGVQGPNMIKLLSTWVFSHTLSPPAIPWKSSSPILTSVSKTTFRCWHDSFGITCLSKSLLGRHKLWINLFLTQNYKRLH